VLWATAIDQKRYLARCGFSPDVSLLQFYPSIALECPSFFKLVWEFLSIWTVPPWQRQNCHSDRSRRQSWTVLQRFCSHYLLLPFHLLDWAFLLQEMAIFNIFFHNRSLRTCTFQQRESFWFRSQLLLLCQRRNINPFPRIRFFFLFFFYFHIGWSFPFPWELLHFWDNWDLFPQCFRPLITAKTSLTGPFPPSLTQKFFLSVPSSKTSSISIKLFGFFPPHRAINYPPAAKASPGFFLSISTVFGSISAPKFAVLETWSWLLGIFFDFFLKYSFTGGTRPHLSQNALGLDRGKPPHRRVFLRGHPRSGKGFVP